jgi:hypothetical protein
MDQELLDRQGDRFHELLYDLKGKVSKKQFYSTIRRIFFPVMKTSMFTHFGSNFDDLKYEMSFVYNKIYSIPQKQQLYLRLFDIVLSFYSDNVSRSFLTLDQMSSREYIRIQVLQEQARIRAEIRTLPNYTHSYDDIIEVINRYFSENDYNKKKTLVDLFFEGYVKSMYQTHTIDQLIDEVLVDDFENKFEEEEKVIVLKNLELALVRLHTPAGLGRRTQRKRQNKRRKTGKRSRV